MTALAGLQPVCLQYVNADLLESAAAAAAAAKSLQSCLTLCDPIDGSPPGFPVPGILQARPQNTDEDKREKGLPSWSSYSRGATGNEQIGE